jgi:misacylated tRNA(Ala) deacylase
MNTEELFRDDSTLLQASATVLGWTEEGLLLDRTVFYPQGGGQAGDTGLISVDSGGGMTFQVDDTRKSKLSPGAIAHVPAAHANRAALEAAFAPGQPVLLQVDANRRQAHRRFHTATHLLCALVPHPVDGCSITAGHARLDFHTAEPLDKDSLNVGIQRFVAEARAISQRWISEAELDANPGLVRSMSVQPPRGMGRLRVIDIAGVDLQPCGGTHVANTAEIGDVIVTKIEKKSAMTRRVVLGFASTAMA